MSTAKKRKLHNNELISKTQIALEAIKNYQARTNKYLDKNKLSNHHFNMMKQIDNDYSKLHTHKQLNLDRTLRVQIFPFNQEYYFISTELVIFPVRIFIRNVRNDGILYVGYDREFPGVERGSDSSRNYQTNQSEKVTYDYKFNFNKDIMCLLKNQKKKKIQKIYLTFVAKKQLLMFNLKYDYIGYQGMEEDLIAQTRPKRAYTQSNLQTIKPSFSIQSNSPIKNFNGSHLLLNDVNLSPLIRSKTQVESIPFMNDKNYLLYNNNNTTYNPDPKQKSKNFLQQNLSNIMKHKRDRSQQMHQQKKQKKMQQVEKIKAKRQQLQQFKQKQQQLKQAAYRLKKSIEHYQKIYKEEKIRDRKAIILLTPLVFLSKFVQKSNKLYNKQNKSMLNTVAISYIVKKYVKKLRKNHIQDILKIGSFKIRNQMSLFHSFQLGSMLVLPFQTSKAGNIIFQTFTILEPSLILNHSLNQASKYRQSVRIIQKRWKIKYLARLQMLQNLANRHVEEMVKQYPHLKLGLGTFRQGNNCHKICYEYLVDESMKFRYIYDAYSKRVQEIDEFIEANYKIRQYNKGKPQNKWKKYLDIPKKPNPPQHRIFRNLDILKSMVRGWFQLEYKKILKRNISSK